MMHWFGLVLAAAVITMSVETEEARETAVDRFINLCGTANSKGVDSLPGEDVSKEKAPAYFQSDLTRSGKNHRVTAIDGEYAMRAVMKSSMGALLVKCALGTDKTKYEEALSSLAALTGEKPDEFGDKDKGRRALVGAGLNSFQVFEEKDDWISIYRMDILISADGIDPKYLKKGAKPVPVPKAN